MNIYLTLVFFRTEVVTLPDDYQDDDYDYSDMCEHDACKSSIYEEIDDCPHNTCKLSDFNKLPNIRAMVVQNYANFNNFSDFKLCCPNHGYLHHDDDCEVQNSIFQSVFVTISYT